MNKHRRSRLAIGFMSFGVALTILFSGFGALHVYAQDGVAPPAGDAAGEEAPKDEQIKIRNQEGKAEYACGGTGEGQGQVKPSIDLGCRGSGNAVYDLLFAVLRFLTIGVGILAMASIVVAGIQFSASRGDPKGTAQALKRVWSTLGALAMYLLAYAFLNWVVPGGLFNG